MPCTHGGFQIFDDFVFKFLRVFVAGLEIPDGGVEAVDAVEGATGDVKGVAHAFSVGDNEGFVVGDHPLGHAPAIPLTGFRIVGKTVGGLRRGHARSRRPQSHGACSGWSYAAPA